MSEKFTNEELGALGRKVVERLRADMAEECEPDCDCPLHQRTKEERAELIDEVIEKTVEELGKDNEKR